MEILTGKPLQPLNSGMILIVGAKASNLDDDIKTNPRVIVWDSQNEHWTNKDLPTNARVIFITRFVSHATTEKIIAETRKRQLTLFNVDGTGMIVKQVRELLGIARPTPAVPPTQRPKGQHGKLKVLIPFIDFSQTNTENGKILYQKAKELGVPTTEASIAMMVGNVRRKMSTTGVPKSIQSKVDVSVEILDSAIQELKDVRTFLIQTVDENTALRAKLDRFKKAMEE